MASTPKKKSEGVYVLLLGFMTFYLFNFLFDFMPHLFNAFIRVAGVGSLSQTLNYGGIVLTVPAVLVFSVIIKKFLPKITRHFKLICGIMIGIDYWYGILLGIQYNPSDLFQTIWFIVFILGNCFVSLILIMEIMLIKNTLKENQSPNFQSQQIILKGTLIGLISWLVVVGLMVNYWPNCILVMPIILIATVIFFYALEKEEGDSSAFSAFKQDKDETINDRQNSMGLRGYLTAFLFLNIIIISEDWRTFIFFDSTTFLEVSIISPAVAILVAILTMKFKNRIKNKFLMYLICGILLGIHLTNAFFGTTLYGLIILKIGEGMILCVVYLLLFQMIRTRVNSKLGILSQAFIFCIFLLLCGFSSILGNYLPGSTLEGVLLISWSIGTLFIVLTNQIVKKRQQTLISSERREGTLQGGKI